MIYHTILAVVADFFQAEERKEDKYIRSNEVEYRDHPLVNTNSFLGVLVKAVKYEDEVRPA